MKISLGVEADEVNCIVASLAQWLEGLLPTREARVRFSVGDNWCFFTVCRMNLKDPFVCRKKQGLGTVSIGEGRGRHFDVMVENLVMRWSWLHRVAERTAGKDGEGGVGEPGFDHLYVKGPGTFSAERCTRTKYFILLYFLFAV